jgi:hypothetical protein
MAEEKLWQRGGIALVTPNGKHLGITGMSLFADSVDQMMAEANKWREHREFVEKASEVIEVLYLLDEGARVGSVRVNGVKFHDALQHLLSLLPPKQASIDIDEKLAKLRAAAHRYELEKQGTEGFFCSILDLIGQMRKEAKK